MRVRINKETVKRLREELLVAQKLNNLRLYKMTISLLLINEEYSMEQIAGFLNISIKTIYNWLSKFMLKGIACLFWYHYRGRGPKPKLTNKQKDQLYKIIEDGPERYEFDCGLWNSAMIGEVIQKEFQVQYNVRYISSLLRNIGLSYQKAAFISDHLDEKKREEWQNETWPKILKEAKSKKAVILFCDEVSFAQWGSLGRTWAPKGKQPKVKTTGIRKALKIFGAIEFFNGAFKYRECEGKFKGDSYITFLKELLNQFSAPVILIEDGAPYHGSKIVNEFKETMKAANRLFVYRLPSYSPDYNPIEKLWKNTKKEATHCKYFPTFEALRLSVVKAFKKYMENAQKVICVMSKLRAEAGLT
jgi:transposase